MLLNPHNFSKLYNFQVEYLKSEHYKIGRNWRKKLQIRNVEYLLCIVWAILAGRR
ncbi:hypothetical protein D1BOALGB6SA_8918 [Olavius sp. associated proteobacterium Delta 1]|nr:hypothetical protein D1BOALGB6SA_8918 [Olavius sp. associated proteobacterium Delta 1]